MRRFIFGLTAVLLTVVALQTKPASACPITSFCDPASCRDSCLAQGAIDGVCGGKNCINIQCLCLFP
jgi:hypothetical protein